MISTPPAPTILPIDEPEESEVLGAVCWSERHKDNNVPLHENTGNVIRPLVQDLFLQHVERRLDSFFVGRVGPAVAEEEGEGREGLDKAGVPIGPVPAPAVTRGRPGVSRGAVVRPKEGNNLVPPGVAARHENPGLVRFGARAREDGRPQRSWQHLRHELVEPRPNFGDSDPAVDEG
jgi:hypothetical protein